MSIELVPCHADKNMFMLLAKEYIDTLKRYDDAIVWDEKSVEKWIWDSRFIVDGGVMCGFIVTQEVRFKNSPSLMYIAELYVEKEERLHGAGIGAVKAAVDGWDGEVFLYILDHNKTAREFWNAVEEELGWERTARADVREEQGCELRVYKV